MFIYSTRRPHDRMLRVAVAAKVGRAADRFTVQHRCLALQVQCCAALNNLHVRAGLQQPTADVQHSAHITRNASVARLPAQDDCAMRPQRNNRFVVGFFGKRLRAAAHHCSASAPHCAIIFQRHNTISAQARKVSIASTHKDLKRKC